MRYDGPVHGAFGLTYASYLVWPRVLMERMPMAWQKKFVRLARAFNDTFEDYEPPMGWAVQARDQRGRFVADPLRHYRHPDPRLIERLWRKKPA